MDDHDRAIRPADVLPARSRTQLAPVVAEILAANPTPDVLRELLSVQQEWQREEARRAYTEAIVALRRDLPSSLARDQLVDYQGSKGRVAYRHTSLAAAVDAIVGPMTDHGFTHHWEPSTSDRMVTVTCRITHRDGHSQSCTISAPPDQTGGKSAQQAVASTVTLLQRYTLLSLLGIATADMTEPTGEAQSDHVDVARNRRAAAAISGRGRSVEDAEDLVGRPAAEWTASDLATLREWLAEEEV